MSDTEQVTGGDLHLLWKITHYKLPVVENVYTDATKVHSEKLAGGDEATFGPAYPAWQQLQGMLHEVLYQTGATVRVTRQALDTAIAEYAYVDTDNAKELTEAGKDLLNDMNDPNITDRSLMVEPEGDGLAAPPKDD